MALAQRSEAARLLILKGFFQITDKGLIQMSVQFAHALPPIPPKRLLAGNKWIAPIKPHRKVEYCVGSKVLTPALIRQVAPRRWSIPRGERRFYEMRLRNNPHC